MDDSIALSSLEVLACEKTPARILVDRAGGSYLTRTQLELRADHAAARDAVQTELELADFEAQFVSRFGLYLVQTQAASKAEFLLRPELGRRLSEDAKQQLYVRDHSPPLPSPLPRGGGEGTEPKQPKPGACNAVSGFANMQIVIGDGLSATAVKTQAPGLLPLLIDAACRSNWTILQPFVIRYCRVGVMNDIGELLRPDVVVLLIGERPGLATAESLSAYMAFRPKSGDTDAQRNLISNIHSRGVSHEAAVVRMLDLAAQMVERQTSGVEVKERLPAKTIPERGASAP
jgi:ethanolamine ammonia-lyase small subunit